MNSVAHISFEGGGLVLSARTPYERQLLFEHVELSAKRYGCVQLAVGNRRWTISLNSGAGAACTACSRGLNNLNYARDEHTLCGRCARRTLH